MSGSVTGNLGVNTVSWTGFSPLPDRHGIIGTNNTDKDFYGNFPVHCPNATTPSVKLGSQTSGHEAEGLFYTFTIPATATKFSLLYQYAIVLQNPGHRTHEQPRFRARIIDVQTEEEVNCVSFDFTSSGSLPGFQTSTVTPSVIYKDWTAVSVDLSSYAGRTIRLEFITSDCVFQEHFGYAYINVSSMCSGSIIGGNYCAGDSTTTLKAPFGFASYQWYSDNTFINQVGNSQNLQLAINATPVGSILPVIIQPYPGYGCTDTLYATIGNVQRPAANAGSDVTQCSKAPAFLGSTATDTYEYLWSSPQLLSNPAISNPYTIAPVSAVTDFVVKTTDLLTGCFAFDTVTVTPMLVDTSSSVVGKMQLCPGETPQVTLEASNASAEIQWYRDNQVISGANGSIFRPSTEGRYWAQVKQFGCTDSTRHYDLLLLPLPKPDFVTSRDVQCINKAVTFSNRSSISNSEPLSYLWRFNDGIILTEKDIERTFPRQGNYAVTLVTTSTAACTDSITKTISVIQNCNPVLPTAFTPNKDGKNDVFRPSLMAAKELKRFAVYNRWGNLVFATAKEGVGWDGTANGRPLQTDVFVWVLEYINVESKNVLERGTVTLIR